MKDFWMDPKEKKINKKRIAISILLILAVLIIAVTSIVYMCNENARTWIDKNILRKEITQQNVTSIELEENSEVIAFNQYIGVLNKNTFYIYNNSGTEDKKLTMEITNPTIDTNNRFLAIGEDNGKKLYLIEDKQIAWENSIEGNISQIKVNKNGYVAVTITNTSYKTVIAVYNPNGKEMFKTYLSSTRAADVSISNDNKYLAIGEIDTSGTMIQSNIKIISIEKAQSDPSNSVEKIYNGENNRLITNVNYQDKNKLLCMYTDSIHIIENDKDETLTSNENKKVTFSSIELQNGGIAIEEVSSGLFTADSILKIINSENRDIKQYTTKSVTKEIYTSDNIVGLNLGSEIEFVNTSGWLVKKYIADQEITNVALSDNLAGIIYRDRVEIIKF